MNTARKLTAGLLIVLAIAMIVIGFSGEIMLPPILTGLGFIAIAAVFFQRSSSSSRGPVEPTRRKETPA
jgi:uncharacterized membrane protein YbaN (DUF454 family)